MISRAKKVAILCVLLLTAGILYAFFMTWTHWGIPCVFHLLTGLKCPGCGVSQMCLALLHLDFGAAFRANAAICCLLPIMAVVAGRLAYVYIRYGRREDRAATILIDGMIGILVVFGIVRNIV